MTIHALRVLAAFSLLAASPALALDDLYEQGSASVPYGTPINDSVEFYHQQIAGVDFTTFMFSPAIRGTVVEDPDPFWERVDKQTPSLEFIGQNAIGAPRHLLWDTPRNMAVTLRMNYVDTWSQSDNAIHVAQDLVFGIPNTMMVMLNGVVDSVDVLHTDVVLPLAGAVVLWPPRFLTGLLEGVPVVYPVLDAIPKAMWGGGMTMRKFIMVVSDQTQKGVNVLYKTIHDPDEIGDHFVMYWGDGKSSTHPAPGKLQASNEPAAE